MNVGKKLAYIAASVIAIAWVGSLVLNAIDRTYNPPASLHILMLAVATFLFGADRVLGSKNGKDKHE